CGRGAPGRIEMHLLAGDAGRIDDGDAAVDLGQPPGDIVFLSAADSELAALARAAGERSFRTANLARLSHPLSVDLYLDRTVAGSRLIVVRMMGGAGYWPYSLDRLRALARKTNLRLAVIPGDDRWDDTLSAFSTIGEEDSRALWRYFAEGGEENTRRGLVFMAYLLGEAGRPEPPVVVPHAGVYRPGRGSVPWAEVREGVDGTRPVIPVVFYRALVAGESTAPVDALAEALAGEGMSALPIFVTSLKDAESEAFLREALTAFPPAIVLNATAFAVSRIGAASEGTVLDEPGRPVLQVVFAGSSEAGWRESGRGLQPRDLTMNVVLPEVDGRILSRAVSFKAETALGGGRTATVYAPLADRIRFVARQAATWVRLAECPPKGRRIALILSRYPNREGRLANGVGLDTPESAVRIAEALRHRGYDTAGFPENGATLMEALAQVAGGSASSIQMAEAAYRRFFETLPPPNREAVLTRWGDPAREPALVAGR